MRAPSLIALALAACATVPAGPPPAPPEQSFRDVKGVALLHRVPWRGATPAPGETRRRDVLDALQGALADRGVKTVTVELPERPPQELADVDALARQVVWTAEAARPEGAGPAVASVGDRAGAVLARLGVEAAAVYVRGPEWGARQPSPFFDRTMMTAPPPAAASALALVAPDGVVVTFAWGVGDPWGAVGPANAAEAIDAALALLAPPPAE
jgi:hypothetical protein